jgi:hypothetical protein
VTDSHLLLSVLETITTRDILEPLLFRASERRRPRVFMNRHVRLHESVATGIEHVYLGHARIKSLHTKATPGEHKL